MNDELARAATAAELPPGAEAPREILLMPAGEIPTRPHDGRAPWRNPDADAVVAATRQLGADLPVDYEHQTDHAAENGQAAPAAGWIKRVFARAGAVWGDVEWTGRAKAHIEAREYRFISPTFVYHRQTRVVQRIDRAALTNNPAFYMRAIASTQPETETDMDLAKLRKALGLPDDAPEEKILAAATAASASAAALAQDAKAEEIETAVAAAKAVTGDVDPSKFVPRDERGEQRVGIDFNPSGDPTIAGLKRRAAELIDAVDAIEAAGETAGEIARLKALAMTEIESAAMWAVKAAARTKG